MTILEFQQAVADKLREDEWIRAHGVPVVCEDALDVEASAAKALEESGGICLAVMTPALDSVGRNSRGEEVVEVSELALSVAETAANRIGDGRTTALDAAAAAAIALTKAWPRTVTLSGIRQTQEGGMLVAIARLATSFTLTPKED
ncbi:MAG: hypothetical protein IJQ73_17955 [Kiritimatiellae bacterium]|nr:hypothetical protein [Kiritimatiellia bacterium]